MELVDTKRVRPVRIVCTCGKVVKPRHWRFWRDTVITSPCVHPYVEPGR